MLRLDPRLHHIQRTRNHARHPPRTRRRQNLQSQPNIIASHPSLRQTTLFLIKRELEGGKREVTEERGFVAVEEGAEAFGAENGAGGVEGGAVVVAGVEVGVVVAALELEAGFEDFGGDVGGGGGEVGDEAWGYVRTIGSSGFRET